MSETTRRIGGYEPSVRTVEMVCDRLAEPGLAIGADTARALVRDVLAAEGPRIDARLRESLDTALQTIKIAAQSAMGLLATSGAGDPRAKEPAAPEQLHVSRRPPAPASAQPAARKAAPPPPSEGKRPSGPRRPRPDFEEDERRPVFRRPGRR